VKAARTRTGRSKLDEFIECRDTAISGIIESIPDERLDIVIETMEAIKKAIETSKSCCSITIPGGEKKPKG
jgi:hypothetical protein